MKINKLINVVWAFISVLLFPTFISDTTLGFSNSIFSILMFVAIFTVLQQENRGDTNKRLRIYTHILGFLFAFMTAAGYSLDVYHAINFMDLILSIIFYTHVIGAGLSLFWQWLIKVEKELKKSATEGKFVTKISKIVDWIFNHPYIITIIIIIGWLPVFIADYPGGFRYDANKELIQIINGYDANFPLLHSVIITKLLPAMYNITGSYNTGVTVYVVFQMLLVSLMYTHILYTFAKRGVNRILLAVMMMYCACSPVIHILIVHTTRDVIFSALLIYTMFLFYLMTSNTKEFFKGFFKPIILALAFVLTIMARNNNAGTAMLIGIIVISIVIWFIYRKNNLRGVTIFAVATIAGYWLIRAWLTSICQPITVPPDTGGALSIMSQSIGRSFFYENEKWTEEEVQELSQYMKLAGLRYSPENADYTKFAIYDGIDVGEYFKFWCKIGMKSPGLYLDAILVNSQNMWFPPSVVDGYNAAGNPHFEMEDKCYAIMLPGQEEPVVHQNLAPEILNFYTQIGLYISFEKVPVISMLFSIGFQLWVILNAIFYVMYRKINKLVLPLGIILGYMLISSFVPIVILRYFGAAFMAMPMVIVFTLQPNHVNEIEERK